MEKLLIVEDSEKVRHQLTTALTGEYSVVEGTDYRQAMDIFSSHAPRLVLLDLGLPPDPDGVSQGFRALEAILDADPVAKVVILATYGQRAAAYRAINCGAYDYCHKPIQVEDLKAMLRRAEQLLAVEADKTRLQKALLHVLAETPPPLLSKESISEPMQLLTLREARDMVERGAIMAAMDTSGGNLVKASEILGVCRPTLYDLMKKHGLYKSARLPAS